VDQSRFRTYGAVINGTRTPGIYNVTSRTEQNCCVSCGQPLPAGSKLTRYRMPVGEAEQHGWPTQQNPDGTVTVNMCLQCQIHRAKTGATS
jgi:hypothetical protein